MAFGSFPASNKPLDNSVQPSPPTQTQSQTTDQNNVWSSDSEGSSNENQAATDPDAKIEYEKQKIAYLDALTKLKNLQQSVPMIDAELKKAKSQQDALEKNPPVLPTYEEKEWLSADGKHKTLARLIESDFKNARLKKSDGSIVTVEKTKLSDEGKSLIEKAFVDKEVYNKRVIQWKEDKEKINKNIDELTKALTESRFPEPTAPELNTIINEIAAKKRLERIEEAQRIASQKMEEEQRTAAEKAAADRKAAEDEKKYKERFIDKNGLTLDVKSLQTERDLFGITITGVVYNRNKRKLSYAQITFNIYDGSGAQVGSALANINGLEPDGTWKFSAIGVAENASKIKFDDMSGF